MVVGVTWRMLALLSRAICHNAISMPACLLSVRSHLNISSLADAEIVRWTQTLLPPNCRLHRASMKATGHFAVFGYVNNWATNL